MLWVSAPAISVRAGLPFADPYGQEILRQWNIPADHYAVMQLLLGYAKEGDKHPTPKPRKEGRVIRMGGAAK